MEKIREILKALVSCPVISGREMDEFKAVNQLCAPYFDMIELDKVGNIILAKLTGRDDAPRLMLDAHFDVIGLMVTKIHENGFLSVCGIGGIDTRILPSTEVTVHGKEKVYGVIVSTPPHLKSADSTVPKMDSILIDTGYKKEELEKLVSPGDMITLNGEYTELQNNYVLSSFLDNRSCATACICAVADMKREDMAYDTYVVISSGEETGRMKTRVACFNIEPDLVITTDVNFASQPEIEKRHSIECRKGPSVDISVLTDRELSRGILRLAKENNIPCQVIVEAKGTGTNNDILSITGKGARNAVLSLPLKSMHTTCECVNLEDIKHLSNLLAVIIKTKEADI